MRWLPLLLALAVFPAVGQEIHAPNCLHGCPAGSPATNDLIVREIYVLSSNDRTKFADWVAYRITTDTIGPSQSRSWKADPLLADSETLEPPDYKDAHATIKTDRGHQAPLASFSGTNHWRDTNLLSNITPQKSDLNQGSWVDLETAVRNLATGQSVEVYVMTGPLYEENMDQLPRADESHTLPSGYWKIVAVSHQSIARVAAFIFRQDAARNADHCAMRTTVREVEARSGLNFFHALTVVQQDAIEQNQGSLGPDLGC